GVQVLLDYNNQYGILSDVKDEGRALLQIVHDVAPGADLAFRTGAYGEQDMVNAIFELKSIGCKIIFDDITYPQEPTYQDGILAQAVNTVVEQEVLFFTTAGNFANNSFTSQFKSASNSPSNHAFDGNNDIYQEVAFSEGFYRLFLQWDDIYNSLNPLDNGAVNDLDIYLLNDVGDTIVNNNENNIGKDPIEVMNFTIVDGSATSKITINKASGPDNVNFKYIVFKSYGFDTNNEVTRSSTIAGHANAEGAITIGAMPYWKSPAYDSIPVIAPYSSYGGTSVNGQTPREKPDIVAPDGVNTTIHLDGVDIDEDRIPNFFGTSAAVPHAAGMAALLLSAQTEFGVSFDVKTKMKETAYDMDTTGYDVKTGMGLIQGEAAMKTFSAPIPTITELIIPDGVTPGVDPFNVTIKGKNIAANVQVFIGEELETELNIISASSSQIIAEVPIFSGEDQPLRAYNPPKTGTNGTDGGY
ncbi:MAG: S8 family serine peptidase, partial [Cyclobacteriaceae bacterium]|nr:S8 family serine peptidase [Cyclobacteriaceae bacterium]